MPLRCAPERRRAAVITALAVALSGLVVAAPLASPAGVTHAATTTSRFQPVGPLRVADTRSPACGCSRPDASTVRVKIAGRNGIPAGAIAAAITVTADRTVAAGYVTAYAAGAARPDASVLNTVASAPTANSAIVPLGSGGAVDLFASAPTDLLVDVTGVFLAADAARTGRFVATAPRRLVDTRAPDRRLAPGGVLTVKLPSFVASDATAVAVNITATDAVTLGYLTASPAGTAPSTTSFANVQPGAGARAAMIIVPVSRGGLAIRSTGGGHLLVDLVGWFTGPSAPLSTEGLYVSRPPRRSLDTRADAPRLHPGGTREVAISPAAQATVTNVTTTRSDAAGYVTAYPAGTARPGVSTVNPTGFDSTATNFAITRASTRGVAYYSATGNELVVDTMGYFTGTPVAAPRAPAANTAPPDRVLLVGDSTMAGIRWYGNSQAALQGFDSIVDGESCRRLSTPSCLGRENRVPTNAAQAIYDKQMWLDTVVIMTGYNDWFDDLQVLMNPVIVAARARGADRIIWLTYREGGSTPDSHRAYVTNNVMLRAIAARGVYPDLVLADWNRYTAAAPHWFVSDGTHFTVAGAYGAADYIARWVAHLTGRACPMPWTVGGAPESPCSNPDNHAVPDVMTLYNANPNDIHCYEFGPERRPECRPDIRLAVPPTG